VILINGIPFNYFFGGEPSLEPVGIQPHTWIAFGFSLLFVPGILKNYGPLKLYWPELRPLVLLLFFTLVWLGFGVSWSYALRFIFRILFVLTFCAAFLAADPARHWKHYSFAVFGSGATVLLLSTIAPVYWSPDPSAPLAPERFAGLGSTLTHAHVFSLLIALVFYLFRTRNLHPFPSFLLLFLFGWQLLLTQTRSAFIGLFVCLLVIELLLVRRPSSVASVLVIIIAAFFIATSPFFRHRLVDPLAEQAVADVYSTGRTVAIDAALERFFSASQVLLGAGPGSTEAFLYYSLIVMTHNDYLNILLDLGIMGLGLFVWFFLRLFQSCWRLLRMKEDKDGSIVASLGIVSLVALFIRLGLDTVLHGYMNMVSYLVFPLIAVAIEKNKRKNRFCDPPHVYPSAPEKTKL